MKTSIFYFKIKNKKLSIKVKECKSFFSKAIGLMFKKNSLPLLFKFKKPTKSSIHSFFCVPFIAVWLLNDKIVGIKLVKPYKFLINSKEKFDSLLEIPENAKEFSIFSKFIKIK